MKTNNPILQEGDGDTANSCDGIFWDFQLWGWLRQWIHDASAYSSCADFPTGKSQIGSEISVWVTSGERFAAAPKATAQSQICLASGDQPRLGPGQQSTNKFSASVAPLLTLLAFALLSTDLRWDARGEQLFHELFPPLRDGTEYRPHLRDRAIIQPNSIATTMAKPILI